MTLISHYMYTERIGQFQQWSSDAGTGERRGDGGETWRRDEASESTKSIRINKETAQNKQDLVYVEQFPCLF